MSKAPATPTAEAPRPSHLPSTPTAVPHHYPPPSYPGVERERFRQRGYTVVKRVFAPEEIEALREESIAALERLEQQDLLVSESGAEGTARYSRCDVLSISEVRHMMLDPRIVGGIGG